MRFVWRSSVVLALAVVAACAEAGGEVSGGDLTQAGTAATVAPVFISPCKETTENVGDGVTWTDLYRDIFGPTTRPGSCSFNSGACHAPPGGTGFQTFQCTDQKTCREELLQEGGVRREDGSVKPAQETYLLTGLLRRCEGGTKKTGFMPKEPRSFIFPQKSVDRIAAWIKAGALDN